MVQRETQNEHLLPLILEGWTQEARRPRYEEHRRATQHELPACLWGSHELWAWRNWVAPAS